MIDLRNRENNELKQGGEFSSEENLDTVRAFWKLVVSFLDRLRNGILTTFISHPNFLYIYMDCDHCFHVDVAMETPNLLQPTTSRCLKTSTSGKCSVRRVRKRATHRKNDVDLHNEIYGELQNLNLLDTNKNKMEETAILANKMDVSSICRSRDIKENATIQFEERLLRMSRITLSEFTSSFNKFVRQNGRDFSKTDLAWWFDKFTKYIYLKEVFRGEPTHLREQLIFRSIQSKRDSIMQRLYTLRETHELHLTFDDFYERLKEQSLNLVRKIIKGRQCCGDSNETKVNGLSNENKLLAETSEKDCEQVQNENKVTIDLTLPLCTSSEVRAETIDIEQEGIHKREKAKDPQIQTISERRTKVQKKKKTPKTPICAQEKETKLQKDKPELQNPFNARGNNKPVNTKPLPTRDQSKCLNSTIYITRSGLVQVSQYLETNPTFKKMSGTSYRQERTINFYVDPLDEKDPLPPNVEVKPMPPGGLDEILRNVPPMTTNFAELDEYKRITSLAEKELRLVREQSEKLDNSDAKTQDSEDVLEPQASTQTHETNVVKTLPRNFRVVPNYPTQNPLPFSPLLGAGTCQQFGKSLENPDICISKTPNSSVPEKVNSSAPDKHLSKVTEQPLKPNTDTAEKKEGDIAGIVKEHGGQNKEPGYKMRRFVPLKRKMKDQSEVSTTGSHSKETSESQLKEIAPDVPSSERTEEQLHFSQLAPLNFIDTDIVNEASNEKQEPVYLETNTTIDYSRLVVEPSHGDRPNKKKLQAEIKEKIKTKGEANKHLKGKQDRTAYYFDEINAEFADVDEVDTEEEGNQDKSNAEHTEEVSATQTIVSATDQPQVQDDREFMMVPEEIRRLNDPRLKEIEDKYSLASNNAKDKKKRKDKKIKTKKNVPLKFVTDFHV